MRDVPWPSAAKINGWRLSLEAHSRGMPSPAGAGTWSRGSGAAFVGDISVAPMTHANALRFRAFLHRLRGRSGSFLLPIPGTEDRDAGTAVLDGAAALDANSVTLGSVVGTVEPGDFMTIEIGNNSVTYAYTDSTNFSDGTSYEDMATSETSLQLVQVLAVSGADVTFRPRLREGAADGAPVTFGYVQGTFRLAEATPAVPIRPALCPGLSFAIEEFR